MPSVNEAFENKTLFITGCTGFIGKILIEKILFSLPKIKKIYILIRQKKKSTPEERLKGEIMNSRCFERLRKKHGDSFEKFFLSKVFPIVGDLNDQEPLEDSISNKIKEEIQIIIHSAATLQFNERLDRAIISNVFGTRKMIQFAKTCPNFQLFCQISTCYTNFPHYDYVDEKVYPLNLPNDEEILQFCNRVCKMSPDEISKVQNEYLTLFNYPNTYSFTKSLTENLISKEKPKDFPLVILRPSIVGCSLFEPYPCYIDALSGLGTVYISTGMGVCSMVPGSKKNIADVIPADLVVNSILVVVANHLKIKKLKVLHVGSSSRNPVKWELAQYTMLWYWNSHVPKQSFFKPRFKFYDNPSQFNMQFYLNYTLPAKVVSTFASTIPISSYQKNSKMLLNLENKAFQIANAYDAFCSNDCVFDTRTLDELRNQLSKEENEIFYTDPKIVNWPIWLQCFLYGIQTFILKEEVLNPTQRNLISTSFMAPTNSIFQREPNHIQESVFHSKKIHSSISKLKHENDTSPVTLHKYLLQVKNFVNTSFSNSKFTQEISRLLIRYMNVNYKSILVDENDFVKIRELSEDPSSGPIIYFPTRHQNGDFWIVPYVCLMYGISIPRTRLNNVYFMKKFLSYLGAFFPPESDDHLEHSIYEEYISQMLEHSIPFQFSLNEFVADSEILNLLITLIKENRIPNATLIPIQIQHKNFSELEVVALKPISLRDFINTTKFVSESNLSKKLGETITNSFFNIPTRDFIQTIKKSKL
jgi:nucleoside-diphosphate-sugar epimerase